jgi:hypothetical protein
VTISKSVRNSLPGSVATWALSGRANHVTQDHPVYILRDLDCSVSCRQGRGYQLGKSVSLVVPDLPML